MRRIDVHQGDIIMIDAEPHAGHEMGDMILKKEIFVDAI